MELKNRMLEIAWTEGRSCKKEIGRREGNEWYRM
jgi:hypothetical protein